MTLARLVVLIALFFAPPLLAPPVWAALPGQTRITVEPISDAPPPFDGALARKVAIALEKLGYETGANAATRLSGRIAAQAIKDGARFRLDWTLRDAAGHQIGQFTKEVTAPYRAANPWDALDADTLSRMAEVTALEVERQLEDTPAGTAPVAATAAPPPPKPEKPAGNRAVPTTKVFIVGVKGAPGDGNVALPNALALYFGLFDVELLSAKAPDAYVIEGEVAVTPKDATQDSVKIIWHLKNPKGRELAKIAQDNTVPKGSLAQRWGQTAEFAAEGAADGLLSTMAGFGQKPPA